MPGSAAGNVFFDIQKRLVYFEIAVTTDTRNLNDSDSRLKVRYYRRVMELVQGTLRRMYDRNMNATAVVNIKQSSVAVQLFWR